MLLLLWSRARQSPMPAAWHSTLLGSTQRAQRLSCAATRNLAGWCRTLLSWCFILSSCCSAMQRVLSTQDHQSQDSRRETHLCAKVFQGLLLLILTDRAL
jgi:hypothetical protein